MEDPVTFEALECINAQIDVWIDEEEYGKVEELYKDGIKPSLLVHLSKAFEDGHCTYDADEHWLAILDNTEFPAAKILNPIRNNRPITLDPSEFSPSKRECSEYEAWAHLLWAKLLRSEIQRKGSDCYFRRLDDVVVYLEKNLSFTTSAKSNRGPEQNTSHNLTKLAVLSLLEMSACGERVEQRAYAERAQRILRSKKQLLGADFKNFNDFYDLWAKYNIGVGFFHERRYRDAVLEFNYIIHEFPKACQHSDHSNSLTTAFRRFAAKRLGRELLFLPSVLFRADIQLKLQLVYHSLRTLRRYFPMSPPGDISSYKFAKKSLIEVEAYLKMGWKDESWTLLQRVWGVCKGQGRFKLGVWQIAKSLGNRKNGKNNLLDKLQSLLVDWHIQCLKDRIAVNDLSIEWIKNLNLIFLIHRKSSKHMISERHGYLQQVAEYLALLSQLYEICCDSKVDVQDFSKREDAIGDAIRDIFGQNDKALLRKEKDDDEARCPCKKVGIDLRRLNSEPFELFTKNLLEFLGLKSLSKIVESNSIFISLNIFRDALNRFEKIEQECRANLIWKMRKYDLLKNGSNDTLSWCKGCLPPGTRYLAFSDLLACVDELGYRKTGFSKELYELHQDDYEIIMDEWYNRFVSYLKVKSCHNPRECQAIHFLGLQRWNSASPAQGSSIGGGYFLYHTAGKDGAIDLGIAIDPGFDFVRNLFHAGCSLSDIDIILLSHAHVDHVRDFESIITLLIELKNRTPNKIRRRIHTIMTLGLVNY